MPILAHTLPFLIVRQSDITMAENCFRSLAECNTDAILIIYNQGPLTNSELERYLKMFNLKNFEVLGEGTNVGIPKARQSCFEYIWNNHPEIKYISEIHVDMIFTKDWADIIMDYLKHSDEPMLSPGIITATGLLVPESRTNKSVDVPEKYDDILNLLMSHTKNELMEGFVHPVIHKSEILKEIGGYDTRFLKGMQGYEDDSIILGYRYYMGTRNDWRPKAYLKSRVLHLAEGQRVYLENIKEEFMKNLQGLVNQHGIYGLLQIAKIHNNDELKNFANSISNTL